eukprot:15442795-Alexandrium_andersonii.AAC.1
MLLRTFNHSCRASLPASLGACMPAVGSCWRAFPPSMRRLSLWTSSRPRRASTASALCEPSWSPRSTTWAACASVWSRALTGFGSWSSAS